MHLFIVSYGSIKQTFRAANEEAARKRMLMFLGVRGEAYLKAFKVTQVRVTWTPA